MRNTKSYGGFVSAIRLDSPWSWIHILNFDKEEDWWESAQQSALRSVRTCAIINNPLNRFAQITSDIPLIHRTDEYAIRESIPVSRSASRNNPKTVNFTRKIVK